MRMWVAAELRRHDLRQVLEAGQATTQFDSRRWIADVDIPTAVVVTTRDRAIPLDTQQRLAQSIRDASVFEFDDDHTACGHLGYPPVLVAACREVAARAEANVSA